MKHIFILVGIFFITAISAIYGQPTFSKVIVADPSKSDVGYNVIEKFGFFYINSGYINQQLENGNRFIKMSLDGGIIENEFYNNGMDRPEFGNMQYFNDTLVYCSGKVYEDSYRDVTLFFINSDCDSLKIKRIIGLGGSEIGQTARAMTQNPDHTLLLAAKELNWDSQQGKIWLIKTDSQGNTLWSKKHWRSTNDDPRSIDHSHSGGYIIGGFTDGNTPMNTSSSVYHNGYILEVDSLGNFVRDTVMYSPLGYDIWDSPGYTLVKRDINGGYVYTWNYPHDEDDFDTSYDQFVTILVKLDNDWNEEWRLEWDEDADKFIHNFRVLEDGSVIGCGFKKTQQEFTGLYRWRGWPFKVSATGELLWERYYIHTSQNWWRNELNDLILTSDGGIASVGYIDDSEYSVDLWMIKTDAYGCLTPGCTDELIWAGIDELPAQEGIYAVREKFFWVSPNPVYAGMELQFYNPISRTHSSIIISNTAGERVYQESLSMGIKQLCIDDMSLPPGIYIITYLSGGQVLQSEKLVIQ